MRTIAILAFVAAAAARAGAQEQTVPRFEMGPDASFFQIPYSATKSGGGGHAAIAITPWLAFETRVRLFGANSRPVLEEGGKTLQVFAGARAEFLSRGRWTLYGVLTPGIIHFTNAVTEVRGDAVRVGGATHFALDMGADVGVRLSRRWDAHVEWTGPLYTVRGVMDPPEPPPGATAFLQLVVPPQIESTFHVSAGVSYRAGSLHGTAGPPGRAAWLAGGEIGSATYAPFVTISTHATNAVRAGGFTSFPITAWMDADAGVNVYLRSDRGHAVFEGGRIAQALAGVKLGRRVGRVGYFAKIRGGTQTHSEALPEGSPFRREFFRRAWRPAFEVGTVIETTLHRHVVWRFDAGEILTFFPAEYSQPAAHTIAMTTGLAWRFGER
jgi:hypothetical protein